MLLRQEGYVKWASSHHQVRKETHRPAVCVRRLPGGEGVRVVLWDRVGVRGIQVSQSGTSVQPAEAQWETHHVHYCSFLRGTVVQLWVPSGGNGAYQGGAASPGEKAGCDCFTPCMQLQPS